MKTDLLDVFKDVHDSMTRVMILEAIWVDRFVIKADGTATKRLKEGDRIMVINGDIVNSEGNVATHVIASCHGNISNTTLFFKVKDITTGEESEIYVSGQPSNI